MKYYKGFDHDMTCRGFQYKEGETYETNKASLCKEGFHACENPLDVLNYYDMYDKNLKERKYHEVEMDKASGRKGEDSKVVAKKIKIGAELGITGLFNAGIKFLLNKTIDEFKPDDVDSDNSAQISSSGYSAQIGSSGNSAQIGSSGDYAQIGSSGESAQIGSSGNSARIGSSGYYAQIGSSGNYAQIGSSGENCVVMCAGHSSVAKAKKGSWITLAEWYDDKPIYVVTKQVDGKEIKEDTFYKLIDGKFTEV